MAMIGAAGASAAAAAAARRRRMHREEEVMTVYGREELGGDWEFKILRSHASIFKDPEVQKRVLEEEARAGWVLIEKFDNQRLRLKRPLRGGQNDASLGFDPYRIYVGPPEWQVAGKIVAIIVGIIAAVLILIASLVKAFR
jgi:hypothetical protein